MADDYNTSPPTAGGATFRAYDDGTRLWPAGVTSYITTLGTPDVVVPVLPAQGLPVKQETGHTFAVSLAATSGFNLAQYGGSTVGAGNAVHVQPGTAAVFVVGDGGGSLTIDGTVAISGSVAVTGTFWQATQPVSVASIPSHDVTNAGTFAVQVSSSALPTGASTAAKQPALGTAGTASADVLTVQGIVSMTALKVDGSAVTQPVSDGGGSLTVDGSVSVSGLVPGTGTTALGKAEDSVAADGDTGVAVWAVRKDTPSTTVGADGDYAPFEVDANGRLWVNGSSVTQPVSNAGTFAVQAAQSGAWTITANAGSGTFVVGDGGGSLTVDGTVAATQSGAWNIGTVTSATVIQPTAANLNAQVQGPSVADAAATGNPLLSGGRCYDTIDAPAVDSGDANFMWLNGNGAIRITGEVSHDAVLANNGVHRPVIVGGYASSSAPANVTVGDAAWFWCDLAGRLQIGDGAGSLTVDAPVGTPVFVRLSDGSAAISTLPVSLATVPSHAVTNAGAFAVQNSPAKAASATLANVASSATNVTLQASNANRIGLTIFNDSTAILYVKFGATASSSSFTVKMNAGAYYEMPQPIYTGIVDGIWASATGNARMTELV